MADERESELEQTVEEAAATEAEQVVELGNEAESQVVAASAEVTEEPIETVEEVVATEADEVIDLRNEAEDQMIITDDEAAEEPIGESYLAASAIETAPDLAAVSDDDLATRTAAGDYVAPQDDLVVVEQTEPVVVAPVAAPVVEVEEGSGDFTEDFTTGQAVSLAFLVLLNVIVIGLGIWQVGIYFDWF